MSEKKKITEIRSSGFFISEKAIKDMKQYNPNYEPIVKEKYNARELNDNAENWTLEDWKDWDRRMEEFVKDFEE